MAIKTSSELWGEDARIFTEEAEHNDKLPTPKLRESQRNVLSIMLKSIRNIIFHLAKVNNSELISAPGYEQTY